MTWHRNELARDANQPNRRAMLVGGMALIGGGGLGAALMTMMGHDASPPSLGKSSALPLDPDPLRVSRGRVPLIGYLDVAADRQNTFFAAFLSGLNESGFVEGRNVAIEYRSAAGHYDRLSLLAAELVGSKVDLIAVSGGSPAALATKAATASIPIVFFVGVDPVAAGLVASLNHPNGNLTGVTHLAVQLGPKRMQLLRDLAPTARYIGVLINPTRPHAETETRDLLASANALGQKLEVLHAGTDGDFEKVFATLQQQNGALVISGDPYFNSRSEQLGALSFRHAVPAIYQNREFVMAGGLAAYGGSFIDAYRKVGTYAGRILNGERLTDLPVQQSNKMEMIINLKTAKTLGLKVPLPLLVSADDVIE